VSALAMNGAGVIHDFELALSGSTSEDVEEALGPGRFGMAEETGSLLNAAITRGVRAGLGLGQSVGRFLLEQPAAHAKISVLAAAAALLYGWYRADLAAARQRIASGSEVAQTPCGAIE